MADGLAQVGGNGGNITFQNDTHADASLDGIASSYSFEDAYQKSQANGWKAADGITGAVEKWGGAVFGLIPDYWFHVNFVNGDGIGTATTTLQATRCRVKFDAGKTYSLSATGLANRWTKFGTLQETAPFDPIGYDGIDMTVGANLTIDGNHQLYGTELRLFSASAVQRIVVRRSSTSEVGDAVSLTIEQFGTASSCTVQFGTSSIRNGRARHIYINVLGNAAASLEIFNVFDAQDLHLGGISNIRLNVTAAYTYARGLVFSGTPATADMRGSAGGNDLVDTTWSGVANQATQANINDWRTYSPVTLDELTGAAVSGVTLNLYNKIGTLIIGPVVSNSSGQFVYSINTATGIPIGNAVIARVTTTGGVWIEQGPFTAVFSKTGYVTKTVVFTWPRLTGSFGDQLYAVNDIVPMTPTPSTVQPVIPTRKSHFRHQQWSGEPPHAPM